MAGILAPGGGIPWISGPGIRWSIRGGGACCEERDLVRDTMAKTYKNMEPTIPYTMTKEREQEFDEEEGLLACRRRMAKAPLLLLPVFRIAILGAIAGGRGGLAIGW